MFFIFSLLCQIIPFEERKDSVLRENEKLIQVSASGSIGQMRKGKCEQTIPEHIFDAEERKTDWCSNINTSKTDKPWISVSLKGKAIKLSSYAIRAGCCFYACCCMDGKYVDGCCCDLFSWSLQGSHDNSTWKVLHKVDEDRKFYGCSNRFYTIEEKESFEYIRLVQENPWPGCNYCICLNKIDLYGTTTTGNYDYLNDDSDETVSIIGRVNRNI